MVIRWLAATILLSGLALFCGRPLAAYAGSVPPPAAETARAVPSSPAAERATEPSPGAQPARPLRLEVGIGPDLGVMTGLKGRVRAVLDEELVLGLDLDVGTLLVTSNATLSAVLGWSFDGGGRTLYLTAGAGPGYMITFTGSPREGLWYQTGVGFEWKPVSRFGVGLEGGVFYLDRMVFGWARLHWLFYLG